MKSGVFLKRPNRFIAHVLVDGKEEICHVKNTGRCRELLQPGCKVYVQQHPASSRKTNFSLIAVEKGDLLINMDSQAPNAAVAEWIWDSGLFETISLCKREAVYGASRFDFYVETEAGKRCYLEVKGVTLEENGVVLFPDAPTQRGTKHLRKLTNCIADGYDAYVLFVVQMSPVKCFRPNVVRDPEFANALQEAKQAGVKILAVDCTVTPDSMCIQNFIPVILEEGEKPGLRK